MNTSLRARAYRAVTTWGSSHDVGKRYVQNGKKVVGGSRTASVVGLTKHPRPRFSRGKREMRHLAMSPPGSEFEATTSYFEFSS